MTTYNSDPRSRALTTLDGRLARVAKSVENMGGIVRGVGYATIGLGILGGVILVLAGASARSSSTTFSGVVTGITLILAGFAWGIPLVLVGGYAQMRSLSVQADAARRELERPIATADSRTDGRASVVVAQPPSGAADSGPVANQAVRLEESDGEERVRMLTESEKGRLAAVPPSDREPGWFLDPLGQATQRYWNGTQWTGRIHE